LFRAAVFAPDGKTVVGSRNNHVLVRWDPATGAKVFEAKAHTQPVRRLFVSPDGKKLVGGARRLLTGHSSDIIPFRLPQGLDGTWKPAFSHRSTPSI